MRGDLAGNRGRFHSAQKLGYVTFEPVDGRATI
jgi:hypothetical protein